jgi:uncharacterized Rmd1/YagE family protein
MQVMNEKLGQCMEIIELLRDHLKDKHHTRLEWMIILLISVEVGELFYQQSTFEVVVKANAGLPTRHNATHRVSTEPR